MGAAVALGDVVGEGQDVLVVAVVPPHRDLNADPVALPLHKDRFRDQRLFGAVKILDELSDAAFIDHLFLKRFRRAFVAQRDADP